MILNDHEFCVPPMSAILLIATYESGFQPLHLAQPRACLQQAGMQVTTLDLTMQTLAELPVRDFQGVAFSVPMHTALTLSVAVARSLRSRLPEASFCFYGLYAGLNSEFLLNTGVADRALAGEVEVELTTWARQLAGSAVRQKRVYAPALARLDLPVPDRETLPALQRYAHFVSRTGDAVPAAQVATSRGCLHTCGHCPVVPVYGGRFFVIGFESVTADIAQQVEAGAGHVSFGDPDFLNGPGHSLRVTEWLHQTYPHVSFDFTAKVEHLRRFPRHVARLKEQGAAFVVSAFESVQDRILRCLDKGHTVMDMEQVVRDLRQLDLPLHPTWIPFTPWSTAADYVEFLDWIETHGLVRAIPPLQLSLRLLIPPHSWLLRRFEGSDWLGPLQSAQFIHTWNSPDERVDVLQKTLAELTGNLPVNWDPMELFLEVRAQAYETARAHVPDRLQPQLPAPPRLTEDWFC